MKRWNKCLARLFRRLTYSCFEGAVLAWILPQGEICWIWKMWKCTNRSPKYVQKGQKSSGILLEKRGNAWVFRKVLTQSWKCDIITSLIRLTPIRRTRQQDDGSPGWKRRVAQATSYELFSMVGVDVLFEKHYKFQQIWYQILFLRRGKKSWKWTKKALPS